MPAIVNRFVLVIFLGTAFATAQAENWPQWRGPENNGISHETNIPAKWSTTENVVWKLPLPGQGGSTPVIWGDRIFFTSVAEDNDQLLLMCAGTNGKLKWQKTMGAGNKGARGDEGNSASASPSTDGMHVWAFVGSGDLGCYDFDGNEIWKFNVQDRYGRFKIQFGMTSTPVLDGNRLYLQLIHGDYKVETQEALVVCLDKSTGAEVWKQPRNSDAYGENEHSYASPILYRDDKQAYLLTHGADYIVAHDLKDGHEIWRSGGLQSPSRYDSTLRLVASPVAIPGLIVVPSAKGGQLLALSPNGRGDVTNSKDVRLWTHSRTPDVPSPLIHNGIVYLCSASGGVMYALDAKSGDKVYDQQRIHAATYRSSPVYADGKVYLTARDGIIAVIKAGRDFEKVAEIDMGENMTASPVISGGRIYLRTFKNLWAIGAK